MELTPEQLACATWSSLVEPGDGIHHEIFKQIGPAQALTQLRSGGALPLPANCSAQALERSRERWEMRLKAVTPEADLDLVEALGGEFISYLDPRFPSGLERLGADRPVGLWCRGEELLPDRPVIAIVGARAATPYGMETAAALAQAVSTQFAVISGGAFGIDYAVHRGCLSMENRTWAILAGGVDRPYPQAHTELFTQIMHSGALISELPPGARPSRWRFLYRNRVIAALASVIVVVEAGMRSGALATARHGLSLGVEVAAVPGRVTDVMSSGCNELIRNQATLISDSTQLLELAVSASTGLFSASFGAQELAESTPQDESSQASVLSELNQGEKRVYQALPLSRSTSAEKIAQAAGMGFREVMRVLYNLEARALVEHHEQRWRRKRG